MSTPIYSKTNYKQNIVLYWQQYFPDYQIPKGYHVHHIKPKSIGGSNHPKNLIVLHPDDHVSIHKCRGDKRVNGGFLSIKGYYEYRKTDIDENGLDSYQRALLKGNETKLSNIDENGLNSNQRGNRKANITKLNTIVNGMNLHEFGALKSRITKENDIDENGLTGHDRAVIKTVNTKTNNIDENGLNSHQREAIKAHNTKRNDIDENGNDVYRRSATKRSKTMLERNKRKYPDLYDKKKFIKAWVFDDVIQKAKCINTCGISRYLLESIIKYHKL